VDHLKDQRIGLINTTFILVGPYWWGPGAMPPWTPLNPALIRRSQPLGMVVILCSIEYTADAVSAAAAAAAFQ